MAWMEDAMEKVDLYTVDFVETAYTSLSVALTDPVRYALLIYLVLAAYMMLRGVSNTTVLEFTITMFKGVLIYLFVSKYAMFVEYFHYLAVEFPGEVANKLFNLGTPAAGDSPYRVIGAVMDNGGEVSSAVHDAAGGWFSSLSGATIYAGLVYIVSFIVAGIGAGLIIMSKVLMAVLLGLTPLMVLLLYFNFTKGVFEGWLRAVVMCMLIPVFTYSTLAMLITVTHDVANTAKDNLKIVDPDCDNWIISCSNFSPSDLAPFFLFYAAGILVLIQVLRIAQGVAGSASISAGGAVRGAAGGAAGALAGGLGLANRGRSAAVAAYRRRKAANSD